MNNETTITLRSQTHAIKARRLLSAVGIQARVVKAGAELADRGCGYGIAVSSSRAEEAAGMLRERNITPLRIFSSGKR